MRETFCTLCGRQLRIRYQGVHDPITLQSFDVLFCEACEMGVTAQQPVDLGAYYGDRYYGDRHWITTAYCQWRRLRVINLTLGRGPRHSILDVGCGDGTFLRAARRKGWKVSGTELNVALPAGAGLQLWSSLRDIDIRFDCVTAWHVLEHLRDPLESVREMKRLLAPGGALILAVPDARGAQARCFGRFWFHLDVPRHLFHFHLPSLRALLEAAGFELVDVWHHELEYDLFGWIQSALNAMLAMPNVLFDFLTRRPRRTGYLPILWSLLFAGASLPGAFFLTVISTLARKGGTLIVAARPRECAPPAQKKSSTA